MARPAILQDYGNIQNPPSDNSLLIDSMQLMQQQRQFNAQQKQHQKDKADTDKYRNLNMIDDATDPSKYQSSTQKANSLATTQLLSLRNEFSGKSNLPPDELYMEMQQKLMPIVQGYNSYKDDLSGQEALAKEAVKANPNLDLEKVLFDLQKGVDSHHLTTNPDGSINFNQATIGTPSNALQEILKPENAWKYSKGSNVLMDILKKGGEKGELFSQAPDGTQINYTTNVPFWAQLIDDNGVPITADPKTGLIPKGKQPRIGLKGTIQDYEEVDENGRKVTKKMVVIPKKTMDDILYSDELKYAFEGDWQRLKMEAGINIDPGLEDDLKRVYFSQVLADNGLTQPYVSSRTHLPPQPRVNVRVGSDSKKNDTQDFVLRYKKAIENKDIEGIKEVARGLFSGNGSYEFTGFKIDRDDLGAVLSYKLKGDDEIKQETLRLDDPNIYYKLGGLYQKITGSDSKFEGNVLQGKKDYSNKVKIITAAKLKSLVGTAGYEGYTEKEIQDYYRKNGYEIK